MEKLIYVLDDEPDILTLVSLHLQQSGFKTEAFETPSALFQALEKKFPALLVLDLMLPQMDGLEICKRIRKEYQEKKLPIIMLTAKGEEFDKVLGLELGADDYMTKPFSPKELIARVKAILRRVESSNAEAPQVSGGIIRIGSLSLDEGRFEAKLNEKILPLTSTEFRLLLILAKRPGWVFSRQQLLDQLWGREKIVIDRTIDVHIRHLREKLGDSASLIKNIRGAGYKIETE